MNRIKENLLLPIVLKVTQVPLGLYGQADDREVIPICRHYLVDASQKSTQ
jgi:hypothetical protein